MHLLKELIEITKQKKNIIRIMVLLSVNQNEASTLCKAIQKERKKTECDD